MKKVVALVTLVFFLSMSLVWYPMEATAAVPLVVGPVTLGVAAGLAAAAGVVLLTSDGARAVAFSLLERGSEDLRNAILGAVGGTLVITRPMWQELQSLLSSGLEGEVSGYVLGSEQLVRLVNLQTEVVNIGEQGVFEFDFSRYDYGSSPGSSSLYVYPLSGSTYLVSITVSPRIYGDHKCLKVTVSRYGVGTVGTYYTGANVFSVNVVVTAVTGQLKVEVDGQELYSEAVNSKMNHASFQASGLSESVVLEVMIRSSQLFEGTLKEGTSHSVDDVYFGNPAWDLSDKQVTVPTSVDDVVGKRAFEVVSGVSDVVAPPGVDTESGTVLGWLSSIYGALAGLASGVIALPGRIAVAISDAVVGDLSAVDFSPLVSVLGDVTRKFPFSLPWDLYRGIQAVAVSGGSPPEWHWNVTLGGYSFPVDIVIPESLAGMVVYFRWALLIMWDLGLVFGMFSLMRGAS